MVSFLKILVPKEKYQYFTDIGSIATSLPIEDHSSFFIHYKTISDGSNLSMYKINFILFYSSKNNMSSEKKQSRNNRQNFIDRKLLKDLPFYRRYPRTFVVVGSTLGFLILFSKGFYDFFRPNTVEELQHHLAKEKLFQLKLQKEREYVQNFNTLCISQIVDFFP